MTSEPKNVALGLYPTPLFSVPKLSEMLGIELIFKDEASSGFGLGGNKIRAIEYLMGDSDSWDAMVLCGGCQSNFVRAAALACVHLDKRVVCAHFGRKPATAEGNHQVLKLAGVESRFSGDDDRASCEALGESVKKELEGKGLRVKLVPRGGALPEGAYGFYKMQDELEEQAGPTMIDDVVVPVGTGTTMAGLMIDNSKLLNVKRFWGFCTSRPLHESRESATRLARSTIERYNLPGSLKGRVEWSDETLGAGYGRWTADVTDTIRMVMKMEGLVLDPVFNAKAFQGLVSAVNRGSIRKGSRVIFINGGGLPTLFRQAGDAL